MTQAIQGTTSRAKKNWRHKNWKGTLMFFSTKLSTDLIPMLLPWDSRAFACGIQRIPRTSTPDRTGRNDMARIAMKWLDFGNFTGRVIIGLLQSFTASAISILGNSETPHDRALVKIFLYVLVVNMKGPHPTSRNGVQGMSTCPI